MLRFRQMKSLQKFASVHVSLHNHFYSERHLVDRHTCRDRRSAPPASGLFAVGEQRGRTGRLWNLVPPGESLRQNLNRLVQRSHAQG
jgi:hypothetical protein